MFKIQLFAVLGLLVLATVTFIGCSSKGVTYKYSNQDETAELVIKKAVYLEDELRLYTDDIKTDYRVVAFDADFNVIDEDFVVENKKGVFVIKGKNAGKISGLYLDGPMRFRLRYLDTNEYAILYEYDVCDIGWEAYGDFSKYYTAEELKAQDEAVKKEQALQDENYQIIEGTWKCEENPELYIKIYQDDAGIRWIDWNRKIDEENYYLDQMSIAVVYINEYDDGWQIDILDDPSWGMSMSFEMSADKTQIIDYEDIYKKTE